MCLKWAAPVWQLPGALLGQGTPGADGTPQVGPAEPAREEQNSTWGHSGLQCDVRELQAFLEQQQSTKASQTTPDPNYRGRAHFNLALGKPRQVY